MTTGPSYERLRLALGDSYYLLRSWAAVIEKVNGGLLPSEKRMLERMRTTLEAAEGGV